MRAAVGRFCCGCCVIGLTSTGTFAQSTRYLLTELPFGTGPDARAVDINSSGQVVGYRRTGGTSSNPISQPALWTPTAANGSTGSITGLGSVSGSTGDYAYPEALNDYGQVTGWGRVNGVNRGFLWTPTASNGSTGVMRNIDPAGSSSKSPAALNSRGQVVGYGGLNLSGFWQPATPNASMPAFTQLTAPAGQAINLTGSAIDDSGRIVGTVSSTTGLKLFTPGTANGSVGTLTSITSTAASASAMNNSGIVVGTRDTMARRWTPAQFGDALEVTIPSPIASHIGSQAVDINNGGAILGLSLTASEASIPWLWTEAEGSFALQTRLEVNSSIGWTLGRPAAINDRGQIVLSASYDTDGIPSTPSVLSSVLLTPAQRGDTNFDFNVDFTDLLTLARHYGTTFGQSWVTGDFNDDGAVKFEDLLLLAQNYGTAATFDADWALAQTFVPEPTAAFMVGAVALLATRRRPA
jgi:hypothetical protein